MFAEIPFTVIGLVVCIGVSPLVVKDYINPGPHDPYCTLYQVPCDEEQEDCNTDGSSTFNKGYFTLLSVGFALLIGSMGYITWKFYFNQRKLKRVQENAEKEDINEDARETEETEQKERKEDIETLKFAQETYKTIAVQAFLYIMAFNCVWIFGLLALLFDEEYLNEHRWLQDSLAMLRMIFQPSQESGVDACADEDVKQASVGGISNGLEISDKSPSFKGSIGSLGGFSGFSSNFKSDVSNNMRSKSNILDPVEVRNDANFSTGDDNDISYAKESTLSNDSNLSFKSFFSKKKDRSSKDAKSKVESTSEKFDEDTV
ncbi:predicted protein [Chaetoceros tenuissimus]|uniref:Uncharacterized protein n=1 Tax=Chaetoceros tenuissimus TaxID=426638 RepID=A0AAD3DBZ4_9STRA|nr:predicted protein [Chaetoceros tenuissimus]